jgi:putative tryptophan/tyrosine transport system substrate-binding protein
MIRREFIALAGSAAVGWPLAALGQQKATPVIGYLSFASPGPFAPLVAALRQGLSETDYVAGQNVAIEYRWAATAPGSFRTSIAPASHRRAST